MCTFNTLNCVTHQHSAILYPQMTHNLGVKITTHFNSVVQRWAAHWVCDSKLNPSCYSWSSSTDICISILGWPSIMNRFTASCLLYLFDLLHNKIAMSFNDYFQLNTSSTKSHSLTLVCKQSDVNSYRYSFCELYFYLE